MSISKRITSSKSLYLVVGLSLLFFLLKGLNYALIESYIPLLFIIAVIVLLYFSFSASNKAHRRVLRFWAIIILIWAVVRIGLWVYLKIDNNLTESHLREQFGLAQNLISVGMLITGIFILKEIKKERILSLNAISEQ